MEEKRRIRSQYATQYEKEMSARKAAEFDMRDYQKRTQSSKGQILILQFKLEIQEEKIKELRSHYFAMEKNLIRTKQERQGCQDYIDSFKAQINSKIVDLDIEIKELQRAITKVA
jgi:predicted  nucleic acid-binding Zn-ribbon protein